MSEANDVTFQLLTERQLRDLARRRLRVMVPAMLVAVVMVFSYLLMIGLFRDLIQLAAKVRFGDEVAQATPIALILPAFAVFLIPLLVAERYVRRFQVHCPSCGSVLNRVEVVIATKRCPLCDHWIVVGLARSHAVYMRLQARRERGFLAYWLWAWPALGFVVFVWWNFAPDEAVRCNIWVPPMIGTVASGWSWLRTFDRRYMLPMFISGALLGILGTITWMA